MAVYVATYDIKLGAGVFDYADLWAAFGRLDSEKILYSVYLVSVVGWSSDELYNYLRQFMDAPDRLWVSRVTDDHMGYVMGDGAKWLEQHRPL